MSEKHLYLVLFPNNSLIASQLEPARFAKYLGRGSTSFLEGNFLFAEVDPDFRNDYFRIEAAYSELKPHEDGRPKASKFVSNYRTLEHIDFGALRNLYYCNAYGDFVEHKSGEYSPDSHGNEMRIFLDINPTKMTVLTRFNFPEYGNYITGSDTLIGAPAMLYTQVNFYPDDFLTQFAANPFSASSIPSIHPARLRDSIMQVRTTQNLNNKGLSMDCPFDKISYKDLRSGFMFASKKGNKYYPLVSLETVEKDFYQFWKSL